VFKGQAAPQNQVHDCHPPISPEGMYWVVPVPDGGLTFSADGKTATLAMKNVRVVDQPKWPAMDANATPGFMDFKLVMKAGDEPVKYENPKQWYRFTGFKATAQLEATIRVPSLKFEFKTDPLEKSSASFAVMGEEVNGRYYNQ
jgi:hypothetical protein